MGCCCGKKKTVNDVQSEPKSKKSSTSSKGRKSSTTANPLSEVEEYQFNSGKDDWKVTDARKSIEPSTVARLEKTVEFEKPKTSPPKNQVSNVILFDTNVGSEVYSKVQEDPDMLIPGNSARKKTAKEVDQKGKGSKQNAPKSPPRDGAGESSQDGNAIKTEFYKTKIGGVEKIAVVFTSASDDPIKAEEMNRVMTDFMNNVHDELPHLFEKGKEKTPQQSPSIAFVYDSGRPVKVAKAPRQEIVRRPQKTIDFAERFNQKFGRFFEAGPGHITLPRSPHVDDLPGFSQVKPGWLNINNVFYFIILIERNDGQRYLNRLRSNPATSLLAEETQGDFFQCEYAGLEMIGLRLYHAKNLIQKIDKAQRILQTDNMRDIPRLAIHTDFDYKTDPFDMVACCDRLELDENARREYLLVSAH